MASNSVASKAYEILKGEIVSCALPPGQQIAQPKLAEKYRLGLTPIREALQRLVQDGYLQPLPRFGYVVTSVSVADIRETFEVRSIVEPQAARLATLRGSQEQLQRIVAAADFTYDYNNRESYLDFLRRNAIFHLSIVKASNNQRLIDLISRLLEEQMRFYYLGMGLKDSSSEMHEERLALARAILDRDAARAEEMLRLAIADSESRIIQACTNPTNGSPFRSVNDELRIGLVSR